MSSPIKRALLSVSDKAGLKELAAFLAGQGVEILSTGGTATMLKEAGIKVKEVSEHTGFPEMLDGRVKTLHPMIHGGLLGKRGDDAHIAAMRAHGITHIDLVVINLYPFEATIAKGCTYEEAIENIDIGGPAMIRSAAKNHEDVVVLTDAADYSELMKEMQAHAGTTTLEFRKRMAAKAYTRTAAYDTAISTWFGKQLGGESSQQLQLTATLKQSLRYGENPHQKAAFYVTTNAPQGVATARQVQGKELSYNNINDTDAAFELVSEFPEPAVAIIKHANPCGVAVGMDQVSAFESALKCDPVSAFGGIIALNRPVSKKFVEALDKLFLEVIIAPGADKDALPLLEERKNLRLLLTDGMPDPKAPQTVVRQVAGGYLVQDKDSARVTADVLKVVTKQDASEQQIKDMLFAFTVAKHVKSNAIVLARDGATIGIGAGQMSRVDSVRIACIKAGEAKLHTKGAVLASDAFFPFDDNVHRAAEAGIAAIIQPGGSIRDEEVIKAADQHGMAMVFTGVRHFKH